MQGFKIFILRGNVVDLAVGIAIGAAFNNIVNALVKDVITPITGGLIHLPDFSGWNINISGQTIAIGDLINVTLSFIILALVIYFLIVLPMNALVERMKSREKPADPTSKKCTECLSEIPLQAKRCAYCTQVQAA